MLENQTLNKITVGNVLVVYANTANAASNTQSTTLGSNTFVAYYPYTGDTPTLPITSGISFLLSRILTCSSPIKVSVVPMILANA